MTTSDCDSRYGDPRAISYEGNNTYTVSGPARYYRVGMNEANTEIAYFDPEGGPFIAVDDRWAEFDGKRIVHLTVCDASEGHFCVRVQVAG